MMQLKANARYDVQSFENKVVEKLTSKVFQLTCWKLCASGIGSLI